MKDEVMYPWQLHVLNFICILQFDSGLDIQARIVVLGIEPMVEGSCGWGMCH